MKFLDYAHVFHAAPAAIIAANEDIYAGGFNSDIISMENAESCIFLVIQNAGATGSASIQIFACDDVTPTNSSAISFHYKRYTAPDTVATAATESVLLRTTAGADQVYAIEVSAAKLAELGYGYVRMAVGEAVNDAVDGAVVAFLMGMRSAEDNPGSQAA